MTLHDLWTLFVGIVLGWNLHGLVLQIAYRRGIVEYKGTKK